MPLSQCFLSLLPHSSAKIWTQGFVHAVQLSFMPAIFLQIFLDKTSPKSFLSEREHIVGVRTSVYGFGWETETVYSIAESDSFVFLIFILGIEPMALSC